MPAAKRYTQTQVDAFMEALRNIPSGKPPEPDFSKDEVMEKLEKLLRKRVVQEHASIDQVIKELKDLGLNLTQGEISKRTKSSERKKSADSRTVPPLRGARTGKAPVGAQPGPEGGTRGGLRIDSDEDEN